MPKSLRIESVAQIHQMLGRPPPPHPQLTVIAASWQEPLRAMPAPVVGMIIESDLYVVSLKRGDECRLELGRQTYDGQAGSIAFLAPGQAMRPLGGSGDLANAQQAWTLVFHPDLLPGHQRFRFFDYTPRESLHVEEAERERLTDVVRRIEHEASAPPDAFARDILTAHLQILLGLCQRSYARQFDTRAGRTARRLERHLADHFASAKGLPTVSACARALGFSPDYLSDLLRAETGESTRDHIHRALIETAKGLLVSKTASEVAYALGFEHPQHFARLFRQKTGQAPAAWRRQARV